MRVLVTGATGFVGRHLVKYLAATGNVVYGIGETATNSITQMERHYALDINNTKKVGEVIAKISPEVVFHLAGVVQSQISSTFYRVNVLGTANLFEALKACDNRVKVIVASSSAVYGGINGHQKIEENSPIEPLTHYATSKLAQEMVSMRYFKSDSFPVNIVRCFNLIGPGQSSDFVCSSFARQLVQVEFGTSRTIRVGNLETNRDFVDVRDAIKAFALIAKHGVPGEIYNVCSERPTLIRECLAILKDLTEGTWREIKERSLSQISDVQFQVGSAQKIRQETGWTNEIVLEQSLNDLLYYWREKVSEEREVL